ncbi:MAG: periplasmic heavy metal sensor [Polyangiaceae bacterium]
MFGFVFGTLCLIGLARLLRRGHLFGHGGCYGSYGGHGECGSFGGHQRRRRGWRRGGGGWRRGAFFLDRLFDELDASPDQETEIRTAIEDVMAAGEGMRDGMHDARVEVGRAFREENLDETMLGAMLAKQDASVDRMRAAIVGALARIHATLDPEQRRRLARWLERGPQFPGSRFDGPYRTYA